MTSRGGGETTSRGGGEVSGRGGESSTESRGGTDGDRGTDGARHAVVGNRGPCGVMGDMGGSSEDRVHADSDRGRHGPIE